MKLVSACLLGLKCQYSGKSDEINILDKVNLEECIPVCAEQLGGLPTPRAVSGILDGTGEDVLDGRCKVINLSGENITEQFVRGAEEVLKLVKLYGIEEVLLRDGSPSCGIAKTWQMRYEAGKYKNYKVEGAGVLGALLKRNNIKVVDGRKL